MTLSRRQMLEASLLGAGAMVLTNTPEVNAATRVNAPILLNASDFKLRPNIKADQTARLTKAIRAAQKSKVPLYIPAGRYRIGTLSVTGSVEIIGAHADSIFEFIGGPHFVRLLDGDRVTLSNLTFDGRQKALPKGNTSGLISVENIANLTITECRILNSTTNGMALSHCSGRIEHTEVAHITETAIFSLDANTSDGRGLSVTQCHVHDCGNNGIQIWRSSQGPDNAQVCHNRIENIRADNGGSGQNGNGINMFRAHNVLVSQNNVSKCAYSAIRGNKASACQIINNHCADLGEVAIYAEFGFQGAIITGNFIERAGTGISVTNFNEGGRQSVVAQNIVRNLLINKATASRAVGIAVEADSVVNANVVEDTPGIAIAIGWGKYLRDVVASNNVVRNANIGIAVSVSAGAGQAMIANNLVSGSKDVAIGGFDHLSIVERDLTSPAAQKRFKQLKISGNLTS